MLYPTNKLILPLRSILDPPLYYLYLPQHTFRQKLSTVWHTLHLLQKLRKRGTLGTFLNQNVNQHCGCLCCLTPQLLSLNHCESYMIHHCSRSSHNCQKCSLYHSILLWCSWDCILKNNPQLFLVLLSFQDLVLSSIITPIIFTWILCLAFKAFIQSVIDSTCSFFFFRKKLFLYFVALSTNITQCCLPPMLGFLNDEMSKYILSQGFLLLSSFYFGIFFCLISPMSNLGNYSLFLSRQPCNIFLWHPSNCVQHVLSLCGSILLIVFHLQSLH